MRTERSFQKGHRETIGCTSTDWHFMMFTNHLSSAVMLRLGAVLLQDHKPVAYASRSMTCAETRYAQIEKELLAVLFFLEKFHQYIYGTHVDIESDHKPLEIIT